MVTKPIQKLLRTLEDIEKQEKKLAESSEKIQLNKMIGKVAFFYEKLRNILEYSDEHLLRKNAIARILKRRLVANVSGTDISRFLINELIRARYIEDNTIPEIKINNVAGIINKYIVMRNDMLDRFNEKVIVELYNWTLQLMACEIEECLVSSRRENAYIEAFYQTVEGKVSIKDKKIISERELGLQLYIAIVKAVTRSDDSLLSYRLLKLHFPEWKSPDPEFVLRMAREAKKTKDKIDMQVNHPIGKHISKNIKPYAVYFKILRTVINDNYDNIDAVISDKDYIESEVKKECNILYKKVKVKLRRSVFRSIIYIFVTKVILALIVEVPFDLYLYQMVEKTPLLINIIFPPSLLFFITMTAKAPSVQNTQKIIDGMNKLIFGDQSGKMIFEVKKSYNRNKFLQNFFRFMYLITFIASYGVIIWVLHRLHFNIISGILFLLFFSLVSYFGIRVRTIARELVVLPQKENLLKFLLDMFSYPIIRVGQWITVKSSKINVFIFILDFIIEAPFKTFIEIIEEWSGFIREKKEEIY